MAKKKKTVDELLQEALVLEDEQPYDVPENWTWIKMKYTKMNGESFGDGDWILSENIDPNGEIRLIQLSDIGQGKFLDRSSRFISLKTFIELGCTEILPGDILISRMAHPIVRSCIVPDLNQKLITAVDIAYLRPNGKLFDKEYLNFMFNSMFFRTQAEEVARGTTRLRITRKNLGELAVPFPPINEQKRIVKKLERLLNKVDEAKQLIEEAKGSFELRWTAILDKAFRGELTKEWRKAHSSIVGSHNQLDIPSNWKMVKICDVVEMQNGMSKRRGTTGSSVPVLRLADIKGSEFDDSNLRNILLTEKELIKYKLNKDDILFIRVNGSKALVGKAIHFTLENDIAYCDHLIRGTFDKNIVTATYIKYLFESQMIRNQIKGKIVSSAGQNTISQGSLGSIEIPLPPIEEIHEIENILNRINIKEKELATYYNKIDTEKLKQSIFSKAFRGELGTNDLNEENPVELLKEVLAEQVK